MKKSDIKFLKIEKKLESILKNNSLTSQEIKNINESIENIKNIIKLEG